MANLKLKGVVEKNQLPLLSTYDQIFILQIAVAEKVLAKGQFLAVLLNAFVELDIFGFHLAVLHHLHQFYVVLTYDTNEIVFFLAVKH